MNKAFDRIRMDILDLEGKMIQINEAANVKDEAKMNKLFNYLNTRWPDSSFDDSLVQLKEISSR